jgi:hypothetical protein
MKAELADEPGAGYPPLISPTAAVPDDVDQPDGADHLAHVQCEHDQQCPAPHARHRLGNAGRNQIDRSERPHPPHPAATDGRVRTPTVRWPQAFSDVSAAYQPRAAPLPDRRNRLGSRV